MEKYIKVRKIGQGSYGSAFLATRKNDAQKQQLVIKEILLDPRDATSAQREAQLLAALDHPNIVACKESFVQQLGDVASVLPLGRYHGRPSVLCIVTEFADNGDLNQELERRKRCHTSFNPHELLGLFVQVCLALKHLHDRKILHRDVKPANIFLTKAGVVKLGDLGVATVLSHTLACAQTSIGTPYYTAPEICLNKRYNAKADVWSLGCVLFEMSAFAHVFDGRSHRQLMDNIIRGPTPPLPLCGALHGIQQDLQALVNDMLQKEPRARPSVNQILHRPFVLARIQTFLSTRALASELNHTVLHGENILQKMKNNPCNLDQRRRASLHAAKPPRPTVLKKEPKIPKPLVRRSVLSVSQRKRGFHRSRSLIKPRAARAPVRLNNLGPKQRMQAKPGNVASSAQMQAKLRAQIKTKEAAAAAVAALPDPPLKARRERASPPNVSERVAAFNAKWGAQKEQLVKKVNPPPPPLKVAKRDGGVKSVTPSLRVYPKPILAHRMKSSLNAKNQVPPPPAPVKIAEPKRLKPTPSSLRAHRLEFQRKQQGQGFANPAASPFDDPVILVQQLPDAKPIAPCVSSSKRVASNEDPVLDKHENESTMLPLMANLDFERMVLQLKSAIDHDTTIEDDVSDDDGNEIMASPPKPLETVRLSVLEHPSFRHALRERLQSNATSSVNGASAQAILEYMHTYITSLLATPQ